MPSIKPMIARGKAKNPRIGINPIQHAAMPSTSAAIAKPLLRFGCIGGPWSYPYAGGCCQWPHGCDGFGCPLGAGVDWPLGITPFKVKAMDSLPGGRPL
jgi:hypothetical protein